jgi:hypothetical protein
VPRALPARALARARVLLAVAAAQGEPLVAAVPGDITLCGPAEWRRGDRRAYLRDLAVRAEGRLERDAARVARRLVGDRAPALGRPLRRLVSVVSLRPGGDPPVEDHPPGA